MIFSGKSWQKECFCNSSEAFFLRSYRRQGIIDVIRQALFLSLESMTRRDILSDKKTTTDLIQNKRRVVIKERLSLSASKTQRRLIENVFSLQDFLWSRVSDRIWEKYAESQENRKRKRRLSKAKNFKNCSRLLMSCKSNWRLRPQSITI
jgi:hypothetical protein